MDNLEKYINEHRDEFDDAIPSLKVWAAIDKQLAGEQDKTEDVPKGRPRLLWRKFSAAASVLLLLTAGVFIGRNIGVEEAEAFANAEVLEEIEDMRHYYESEINQKQAKLVRYNEGKTIRPDLEQIDEQLRELMDEIKNVPEGEEEQVINAMVYSYQTKIAILEKVLKQLEEKKEQTDKSSEHETNI